MRTYTTTFVEIAEILITHTGNLPHQAARLPCYSTETPCDLHHTKPRRISLLPPLPPSWRGGRGGEANTTARNNHCKNSVLFEQLHTVPWSAKLSHTQKHNAGWCAADPMPSVLEWLRRRRNQQPRVSNERS